MNYPVREKYDAHRVTRLLLKSCAAQDIGHHAVLLIIHIAHTEDAARYQGPVRFWNSQLMETLGFKSPKQLTIARSRAITAGWLHYEREGTRAVGRYWFTVPDRVKAFDDQPIEEAIHSPGGTNNGTNEEAIHSASGKSTGGIHSHNGTNQPLPTPLIHSASGTQSGTRSGKLSYPYPFPKEDTCGANNEDAPGFLPWPLKDGTLWTLPQAKLNEWIATYTHLDVPAKLRELRQWSEDNPAKRKTRSGILRHLSTCLSIDNGKARPKAEARPRPPTRAEIESSGYTFVDASGEG